MMIGIFAALITGVLIYRLGRRDGEVGHVTPLLPKTPRKTMAREEKLLRAIDRFDGNPKGVK